MVWFISLSRTCGIYILLWITLSIFVSFLANLIAVVCRLFSVTAMPPAHFTLPLDLHAPQPEPHHVGHRKRASWHCFLSNVSLLAW